MCSILDTWGMPIVLSTNEVSDLATGRCRSCPLIFSGHVLQNEDCMCISLYITLWTLNTSTTTIPAAATYMTALPKVTTREWLTARRPYCFTRPHSFFPGIVPIHFPVTYAFPSHGSIRLSSLRFTCSAYPPLSRGLLLRASSSQNGPPALWWKANRLPRGSGSLDRYMLIAA